jgi:hypothetical protein
MIRDPAVFAEHQRAMLGYWDRLRDLVANNGADIADC